MILRLVLFYVLGNGDGKSNSALLNCNLTSWTATNLNKDFDIIFKVLSHSGGIDHSC